MTKTYEYKVKPRPEGTNTTYHQLRVEDRKSLLEDCKMLVDFTNECKKHNDPVWMTLEAGTPKMPRRSAAYGGGRNSAYSICEGIIENFKKGQYDISHKQMPAIVEAFRIAHNALEEFDEIDFKEVKSFSQSVEDGTVKIAKDLYPAMTEMLDSLTPKDFTYKHPMLPIPTVISTFEDLFEITLTVRAKK